MYRRGNGIYRIATFLRQNDWDVEVIDFAGYWSIEELKELALQRIDSDTKFIGFSYLFITKPLEVINEFGEWLKTTYPDIKIIFGGPNIYRFKNSYTDYNVHGFGELALLELLKYLFSNGPSPKFSLLSTAGKAISANNMYPSFPMKSLYIEYQKRDYIEPYEWLGVEFARGCKFTCDFCNFPVLGVKGDYTRDAEDFEKQMRHAYDNWGTKHYYVSDETFNDRTEKITKFADVVERLDFDPFFTGFIRADLLVSRPRDKEELLRMKFLGQFYGIETFHPIAGKSIGKGMNPDRLKQGIVDVKNYFENNGSTRFRGTISLIAGLPHETVESLYETKDFLYNNWQGQHFSMYPLEIPLSELDQPSKISQDPAKYGYEDVSNDKQLEEKMGPLWAPKRTSCEQLKIMIWRNECMDIFEADKISREVDMIKYDGKSNFKQGSFSLLRLGLPTDIDKLLDVPEGINLQPPVDFIKNYIDKKLGR
jgi:hypothetical protein